MLEIEEQARCLQCGRVIHGRKDKKFCDLGCKNAFHNMENEKRRKYMKNVDEAVRVNYLILDEGLRSGETSLNLERISGYGFRPEIATSFKIRYRRIELGCYDIRYNQSNSKIFNIHRIGLDNKGNAEKV